MSLTLSQIIIICDFLASFFIGLLLVRILLYVSYKNRIFDMPGYRKIHEIPVPRLGGIAFFPTILVLCVATLVVVYQNEMIPRAIFQQKGVLRLTGLMLGLSLIFVQGVVDDISGVSSTVKLVVQLVSASILVASGLHITNFYGVLGIHQVPLWLGFGVSVIFIVWVINAFNMIDGIDGLSGGLGIMSLVVFSVMYLYLSRYIGAMVSVSMLGVVAAYWLFNVFGRQERQTKIFMGDAGSQTLGMVLSYLALCLAQLSYAPECDDNRIDLVFAISTMALPMLDVVRLFFERLLAHKSPFKADANHIHHRIMSAGYSPRQTLVILLSLDVVFIAVNVLMAREVNVNLIILANIALFTLVHLGICYLIRRNVSLSESGK